MKVYIAIIEDRHCDVDVRVFTKKETAVMFAFETAEEYCRHEEDFEEDELTGDMIRDRWVYSVTYSCEGDSVRVVEREVDEG